MVDMTYAGVYMAETDNSASADTTTSDMAAAVFESARGPLGPKKITGGTTQFVKLYGEPDTTVSYGHDSCLAFLKVAGSMYCNRVVGDDWLYAGTEYYNSSEATDSVGFPVGSDDDYETGPTLPVLIEISDALVTGDTVALEVTDETTYKEVTVEFDTDSNTTMEALATSITTALADFGSGGTAETVTVSAAGTDDIRLILMWPPSGTTEIIEDPEITHSGSGTATISTTDEPMLFAVMAENPGEWASDSTNDYGLGVKVVGVDVGTRGKQTITIDQAFVDSNVFSLSIDDTDMSSITYTTSSDYTLELVANEIGKTLLSHSVSVTTVSGDTDSDLRREITITNPSSKYRVTVDSIELTVTGGDSQATFTYDSDDNSLTASAALVTDNTISGTVTLDYANKSEEFDINDVDFTTNSNTTMALLATEIEYAISQHVSTVTTESGSTENDREIIVVSPIAGTDPDFESASVTGGDSQPTVYTETTLDSVAADGTFTLKLYKRESTTSPVKTWTVSLDEQTDGNDVQLNIAEKLNTNSTYKSDFIRIYQPDYAQSLSLYPIYYDGDWVIDKTINWLQNGEDGTSATSAELIAGWEEFSSKTTYVIRMLINCGYDNLSVKQEMVDLAEDRFDCFAILDVPTDYQSDENAVDYRNDTLNIDSSYGAIFTPDLQITDTYSDKVRYTPPSGYVAATMYSADYSAGTSCMPWFTAAGEKRGVISDVDDLRYDYNTTQQGDLDDANVNVIIQRSGVGIMINGGSTLQSESSALSYIAARRMLIQVEAQMLSTAQSYDWDPNDETTRDALVTELQTVIDNTKNQRGIKSGAVVDATTTANEDAGIINLVAYIIPTLPGKYILITTDIEGQSADLTEYTSS